jgi:hypothetical protein
MVFILYSPYQYFPFIPTQKDTTTNIVLTITRSPLPFNGVEPENVSSPSHPARRENQKSFFILYLLRAFAPP